MAFNFKDIFSKPPASTPKTSPFSVKPKGRASDLFRNIARGQEENLTKMGTGRLQPPAPTIPTAAPSPFFPGSPLAREAPAVTRLREVAKEPPLPLSSFFDPRWYWKTLRGLPSDVREWASGITSIIGLVGSSITNADVRRRLYSTQTVKDMATGLHDEFKEYLRDPAGKIQRDPFSFLIDISFLADFGAGALLKVGAAIKSPRFISTARAMEPLTFITARFDNLKDIMRAVSPVFGEQLEALPRTTRTLSKMIRARINLVDDYRQGFVEELAVAAQHLSKEEKVANSFLQRGLVREALDYLGVEKIPDSLKPFYRFQRKYAGVLEQEKALQRWFPDTDLLEHATLKEFANRRGFIKNMKEPLTAKMAKKVKVAMAKEIKGLKKAGKVPKWVKETPIYQQSVVREAAERAGIFTVGRRIEGAKVVPAWTHKKVGDISKLTPQEIAKLYVLEKPDSILYKQALFLRREKAADKFIDIMGKEGYMKPQFYISPRGRVVSKGKVTVKGKKILLEPTDMTGKLYFVPAYYKRLYSDFGKLTQSFIDDALQFKGEFAEVLKSGSRTSHALRDIQFEAREFFKWFSGKKKAAPTERFVGMAREGIVVYSIPNNPVTYAVLAELGKPVKLLPLAFHPTYDAVTQIWKVGVLALSPSWYFGNLVGSFILNLFEGVRPDHYLKAMFKEFNIHIPKEVGGGGFAKTVFPVEHDYVRALVRGIKEKTMVDLLYEHPVFKTFDRFAVGLFDINAGIETIMRKALYVKQTEALTRQKILRLAGRSQIKALKFCDKNLSTIEKLKIAQKSPKIRKEFIEKILATHNDYRALSVLEKTNFRKVFPFYNWIKFISTFTLTMPFKRPVPAMLTRALSEIGRDVREDLWASFGVDAVDLEEWEEELIPIGVKKDAKGKEFVLAVGARGLNPFQSVQWLSLAQANPIIAVAAEYVIGRDVFTGRDLTSKDIRKVFNKLYSVDRSTGEVVSVKSMSVNVFYRLLTKFPVISVFDKLIKPYARYTATGEVILDETGTPAYGFGEEKIAHLREAGRRVGISTEQLYATQLAKRKKERAGIAKLFLREEAKTPAGKKKLLDRLLRLIEKE